MPILSVQWMTRERNSWLGQLSNSQQIVANTIVLHEFVLRRRSNKRRHHMTASLGASSTRCRKIAGAKRILLWRIQALP
jgi:hypothetical protein